MKKKENIIIVTLVAVILIIVAVTVAVVISVSNDSEIVSNSDIEDAYDGVSRFTATDNYIFENSTESEHEFRENSTKVLTTRSTTQETTLSEEELNRRKAVEYIDKANSALKEGNRETAYSYAQMAIELCPDDVSVKKKYDYYEQFLPFKLYQSENVIQYDVNSSNMNSVRCFVCFDKSYNSNNNKSMKHALSVEYYDSVVGQLCTINYDLNGKYDKISGDYFLPQSDKNTGLATYFIIYGDGKKIFTSNDVTAGTTPKNFEVKVSSVETLTVEFYGEVNDADGIGFGSLGINDFVALKNLP